VVCVTRNAAKTELIFFGSRAELCQSLSGDRTLIVDDVILQPTDTVRGLGVLLDSKMTMKRHVNRIASTCFFHLRRLRQLKRNVTLHTMKHLVLALILCRLDYYNSVLAGLPWSTVAPLQKVWFAAARLIRSLPPVITSVLR